MRIIKLNFDNGASAVLPLEDIRLVEGGTSIDIYTPYKDGPYSFNMDIDTFIGLIYAAYEEEGEYIIIDVNEAEAEKPAP